jgi:hypothetical protein
LQFSNTKVIKVIACSSVIGGKQEDGKYKHTVDLPKTTFGLRANSVTREPELQKLWEENQVLKRVSERNTGVSIFLQAKQAINTSKTIHLILLVFFRLHLLFTMVLLTLMVIFIWAMH